ncbi:hypothetical protein ACQ4WP_28450 [Janthinobacterium sp. GB4P2]|uniref:hypothetical protein n=1 Tax=Janthinobacterium sp. GB4P2 TaxID=3424189 RepID=UPI003F29E1FC
MDTLKMGIPLPDYLSLSGSTKYLNFGVSISINLHNGTIYAGGFVPDAASNGATATFGYLPSSYEYNRSREDKAKSTDSFMTGASAGLSGCAYGACLGINHAIGGETAKEVGIGFGGISKVPAP